MSVKKKFIATAVALLLLAVLVPNIHLGASVEQLKIEYTYPESQFVTVNGVPVHYRETGDVDKPVVVLMHGVASSLHTWQGWQEKLSEEFRVISFDVPGFGLTGPFVNGAYTKDHYMQFLDELFTALNINTFSLAGNSFGGYLAWNYALRQPSKVDKLILIDAAGFKALIPKEKLKTNIGFLLSTMPVIKYFSWFVTPKHLVRMSVENVYGAPEKVTDELVERYYSMLTRDGNRRAFSSIIPMLRNDEAKITPENLKPIAQPTLVLWGAKDTLHIAEEGQLFASAIANARLIVYPELGHVPMEENPEKTVQDAASFLRTAK